MSDEIKQALSALRDAEKADADADAGKKAILDRAEALKAQLDTEKKNYAAANATKTATAEKVAEARAALTKLLEPGVPWTEAGSTVLIVDPDGALKELALNYVDGRTS